MKLLTLNTHSLIEENYAEKLQQFVSAVEREVPDVIALQEVNQTRTAQIVPKEKRNGYISCMDSAVLREDNHLYQVTQMLLKKGILYYWTWLPIKIGYDKYDEGIGIMSLKPIVDKNVILISPNDDYFNWKTRKLLGVCLEKTKQEWFYSVHFGWWDDNEDTFLNQWNMFEKKTASAEKTWILGDFNSPAQVRGESYDLIKQCGWYDTYELAQRKDSGFTVNEPIDGWREKQTGQNGMRIDQIWCSKKVKVQSSQVIFNGTNYPVVSDHYGILVEI